MSVFTQVSTDLADVGKVGQRLKRLFCQKKREIYEGRFTLQKRHQNDDFWELAARQCIELGVSPATYIEAAFRYNTVPGGPFPDHLGKRAIVGWVQKYRDVEGSPVKEFRQKIEHFKDHLRWAEESSNGELTPLRLLSSPIHNRDVDPVVAVACFPIPKVLELYGLDALDAFETDPVLQDVFKELKLPLKWVDYVNNRRHELSLRSRD